MSMLGAVQMCSGVDVDGNLETASRLIAEAVAEGASLVSLPENFALLPARREDLLACAVERLADIESFLASTARRHGIVLIGGSVPVPGHDPQRVFGCSMVHDAAGDRIAHYEKIHLFDVTVADGESYHESDYTAPGGAISVVDTAAARLGLSICYDMRFPELYRSMASAGAELFSVPSAFTVPTGRAHWEVLLRARAIENFCYVLAAAQYGKHANGRVTWGHSLICDPWGKVVASLADGEGVCVAPMDLEELYRIRGRVPALEHRRIGDGSPPGPGPDRR